MCLELLSEIATIFAGFIGLPIAIRQLILQSSATHAQTLATVISWVQDEQIRSDREKLYDLEKVLSEISIDEWEEESKKIAGRVSQCFNSAAIVVRMDKKLQVLWVCKTRKVITRTWKIVKPLIDERRKKEPDLWENFEWLYGEAEKCS